MEDMVAPYIAIPFLSIFYEKERLLSLLFYCFSYFVDSAIFAARYSGVI